MSKSCLTEIGKASSVATMDKDSERELSIKMSALGRKGSRARAESLSAVQRKAIARKAARARWSKSKKKGKL
jgi:hypothetical protein